VVGCTGREGADGCDGEVGGVYECVGGGLVTEPVVGGAGADGDRVLEGGLRRPGTAPGARSVGTSNVDGSSIARARDAGACGGDADWRVDSPAPIPEARPRQTATAPAT
jgi:hypothetical protein